MTDSKHREIRVGLISTLGVNLGDDLVREGIIRVLQETTSAIIHPVVLNKHRPLEVYPRWHPARILGALRPGSTFYTAWVSRLFGWIKHSRFDACDMIVYAGTPLIWENCHRCEWSVPVWGHVVSRLSDAVPVLIIGGGSCFAWEHQPEQLSETGDLEFISRITGMSKLVTVRDAYAKQLLPGKSTLLPCPAFLSSNKENKARQSDGYVLINYMAGAGHYDYGQDIDHSRWAEVLQTTINNLTERGHRVAFLCHDDEEVCLAKDLAPGMNYFIPRSGREYREIAGMADAAICNRLHACVVLAGYGVPSVAVGVDSRLYMVDQLGLPTHYVKSVRAEMLVKDVEGLLRRQRSEAERLLALKRMTMSEYKACIIPFMEMM